MDSKSSSDEQHQPKRGKVSLQPDQKLVVQLKPAKNQYKDKKWYVIVGYNKISFGHRGSQDYLLTKNDQLKDAYLARHQVKESKFWTTDIDNLRTASFWSRYLLWNKKTLHQSIQEIENMMDIEIKYSEQTSTKWLRHLQQEAHE